MHIIIADPFQQIWKFDINKVLHYKRVVRGYSTTTWTEFCNFFTPLPPLRGRFLYPERGQKQTFFTALPPPILPT